MQILAASLDPEATYKLLVGAVVPRPIAWITTLNAAGGVNLDSAGLLDIDTVTMANAASSAAIRILMGVPPPGEARL